MELNSVKKIVIDSLMSVLDENGIKNISVDDNTEIFGSKSIIDSLQLINLIVKIEEDVYDRTGKEIIVVDDEAIISGNSPFQTVQSLSEFSYDWQKLALISQKLILLLISPYYYLLLNFNALSQIKR